MITIYHELKEHNINYYPNLIKHIIKLFIHKFIINFKNPFQYKYKLF